MKPSKRLVLFSIVAVLALVLLSSCKENTSEPEIQTVATPTFNPVEGSYSSAQSITLSCTTAGAIIRYTIDGSDPTETSTQYSSPIAVSVTTTIKAKAFKSGWTPSATASATYTIGTTPPPADFVFVQGGTFHNGTSNVTLSSFYIDKYEVTQASYQAVMGTNPSNWAGNPNRPVEIGRAHV